MRVYGTIEMNNAVELLSGVSSDYEKLYESGKYTDISIHVGQEPDNKIFLAHSLVLCARSGYFENKLTGNTDASNTNEIQQTSLVFEDLTPDIFEILLRFIYTGKVTSQSCENVSWFVLLEGAKKLGLSTFCTAIGDHLIEQHEEWIRQNILPVYNYALSTGSLQKLGDYCIQLMLSSPDIVLKSRNMIDLPKATFISLLKNDELDMEEVDIWLSVVQWAINHISKLSDNPANWSVNDIIAVKDVIAEYVPHVRFFNISSEELSDRVIPYIDVLPRELRSDILGYHLKKNYKPKTQMLPHRKGQLPDIDSVVISKLQASWILQKIAESAQLGQVERGETSRQIITYKLTLLYRESRDGDTNDRLRNFWRMCADKGPTIAVGSVKETGEIFGGYNPLSWSTTYSGWLPTRESFIFSLDKKDVEKSIISFVKDAAHAIYNNQNELPNFGNTLTFGNNYNSQPNFGTPLPFGNNSQHNFGTPLPFGNNSQHNFVGFGSTLRRAFNSPCASNHTTSYQIPIRSTGDRFTWIDWEVFSVD